jgi:hypothetical protein
MKGYKLIQGSYNKLYPQIRWGQRICISQVRSIAAMQRKKLLRFPEQLYCYNLGMTYFPYFIEAWAAASLAIGTLKGEQLT